MTGTIHTFQHEYDVINHMSEDDLHALAHLVINALRPELVPVKGLTASDAREMLSCSDEFLITLEREGLLRPFRHGAKFVRYDQRQIARLLSTGCGVEQDAAA